MILDDRRMSAKKIAETLAISRGSVGYIIHKILDMEKLSTTWVPKCPNADQKRDRLLDLQAILDRFRLDTVVFLNRLVNIDESWFHIYMIQRPKNNPRNGDTAVPRVQRS
jgi:hypothetical protein